MRTDAAHELAAPARSAPMEHDLGPDELEFIAALDRFKKANGRPFPTWSEVLEVVRSLGYTKHGLPPTTSATTPMNNQ